MKTNNIYILILLIGCLISCSNQSAKTRSYHEVYDLSFRMQSDAILYPWIENAAFFFYTIPFPNTEPLFTKTYLKGNPFSECLKTEWEQRILLPSEKKETGRITLETKGENIEYIAMYVHGMNEEEKIVTADTLLFTPENALATVSKDLLLHNTKLLNIRIYAEGKNNENASVSFSKIEILIDGDILNDKPFEGLPPLSLSKEAKYLSLDTLTEERFEQIPIFSDAKIIGLGESLHQNQPVKTFTYDLILHAVEKHNYRLIGLEAPMEALLSYNRYIHDTTFTIENSNESLLDLANRLQSYNAGKPEEEQVNLFGIDYNRYASSTQNSAVDIFDYITYLNQEIKAKEIDRLALLLFNRDIPLALDYLKENTTRWKELFPYGEYECMIHILELFSQIISKDESERFALRDSVLFQNAQFLIESLGMQENKKAIILAHAVHINPVSTYPAIPCLPFGYLMKKAYGDAYHTAVVLTDTGYNLALGGKEWENAFIRNEQTLMTPLQESIEYDLSSLNVDRLYYPVSSELNRLILSRYKGSHQLKQEFYPYNFYQRYEGIFFVKGMNGPPSEQKENISLKEMQKKHLEKINKRKQQAEEIGKRIN